LTVLWMEINDSFFIIHRTSDFNNPHLMSPPF